MGEITSKEETALARKTEDKSLKDQKASGGSFKKNLAVATIAASLGVSLGVPVGEVLAAGNNLSSPPGYSRQDKQNAASTSMKSNQLKFKQSGQIKDAQKQKQSTQMKINAPKQSSQVKLNTQGKQLKK